MNQIQKSVVERLKNPTPLMLEKSLMHCPVKGVHSIVLRKNVFGGLTRLFFVDYKLWRNGVYAFTTSFATPLYELTCLALRQSPDFHTLYVGRGRESAWLVIDGVDDPLYSPVPSLYQPLDGALVQHIICTLEAL